MRLRENGTKFVLTDEIRANRMVEVASRLDFLQEIFVVGEKVVPGCTPFEDLLQDSGDGKLNLFRFLNKYCLELKIYLSPLFFKIYSRMSGKLE